MLRQLVPFLAREILYSGHLQSLGAAGIIFVTAQITYTTISFRHLLSVYLVFQTVYYYDRYRGLSHDASTNVSRTRHIRLYARFIPVIGVVLLAIALIAALDQPFAVGILVLVTVFGCLYPLVFKNLTAYIPFFKNIYVATVFALLVLLPFAFTGTWPHQTSAVWPLLFFVFIQTLVMQVLLDLKDTHSDRQQFLQTSPIIFGRQATIILAFCITLMAAVTLAGYAQIHHLPGLFILSFGSLLLDLLTFLAIILGLPFAYFIIAAKYIVWPFFYV